MARPFAAALVLAAAAGLAAGAGCRAPAAPEEARPPGAPPTGDLLALLRGSTVVDLTHPLDAAVPYWPGSNYFPLKTWDLARFEEVRAFSRAYSVPEHYGTHVDAPVHFLPGRWTLDGIPPERMFGPAVVFDISARAAEDADAALTAADVEAWEATHGPVPAGAIALLRTGWASRWGDVAAYRNFDALGRLRFPSFGLDAAKVLLAERGCIALGIDCLSVDRGIDGEFPVHRLGSGMDRWFCENMANLDRLPPTGAVVLVAPVPLRGGSGGQARALAFVPEGK